MNTTLSKESTRLRVAMDARSMRRDMLTGIGRYATELIAAYARLGLRPALYWNPNEASSGDPPEQASGDLDWRALPARRGWMTAHLPLRLWRDRAQVLHVLEGGGPFLSPCPTIMTVYDLSVVDHPEWYPAEQADRLRRGMARALAQPTRLIAISEFTRSRICSHYAIPAERVEVTPLAASPGMHRVTEASALAAVREKYGLNDRFILHVGAIQPRKNLARLVEAHAAAFARSAHAPQLALVGPSGWKGEEVLAAIERSPLRERVHRVGYARQSDLPALYSAALCLAYPSLYEGFGLPPVEAMQCGTPVVTTHGSSLPEVVGDAALTVPPEDVGALAQALLRFSEDAALREELCARGLQQASRFSWERTALLTWGACQRAARPVGSGGPGA